MEVSDAASRRNLRRKLLTWFGRNRRALPWRAHPENAYEQWLAEIMLQQTQVATVVPYFARFLKRFPTVSRLAAAPLDEVLRYWSGLGYYARARNLHKCARIVAGEFSGRFPPSAQALQSLPGIGRYTAGAIASIAFGARAAVLDGNVKRVFSRLFLVKSDITAPVTVDRLWRLAEQLLPRKRVGDFNQALMELGATVCSPKRPKCSLCPVARECSALAAGLTDHFPKAAPRARPIEVRMVVAAIRQGGRYLIRRRPRDGLWGGMWELPCVELNGHRGGKTALRELLQNQNPQLDWVVDVPNHSCGRVTHRLTHRTLLMSVYLCRSRNAGQALRPGRSWKWVAPERFGSYAFAIAQQKVIKLVLAKDE